MSLMDPKLTPLIVLLLLATSSINTLPVRPLNERSTEVTWQAWLLVDDQNQNNNTQDDGTGVQRRRITPKSIFIIPNRHGSLPPCADGYMADVMGRCNMVKKITIDVDENDKFVLDFLYKKFGEQTDYNSMEESDEVKPTSGPVQFKFSLDEDGGGQKGDVEKVVVDVEQEEEDFGETEVNIGSVVEGGKKDNSSDVEGFAGLVADVTHETQSSPTTTSKASETTTLLQETTTEKYEETATVVETTTVAMETTTDEQQALFFLEPLLQTEHVVNYSKENATTTYDDDDTPISSYDNNVTTTMRINTNDSLTTSQTTLPENNKQKQGDDDNTEQVQDASFVRFPHDDEPALYASSYGHGASDEVEDLVDHLVHRDLAEDDVHLKNRGPVANDNHHLVNRDPAEDDVHLHNRGPVANDNHHLVNRDPAQDDVHMHNRDPVRDDSHHLVFRDPVEDDAHHLAVRDSAEDDVGGSSTKRHHVSFNHRNRDKVWPPSSWRTSSQQTPLVFRFPRRHGNSRQREEEVEEDDGFGKRHRRMSGRRS